MQQIPDLSLFMEDFSTGLSHKNPQVRTEIIKWLTRCLKCSKKSLNKAEIKIFANSLLKVHSLCVYLKGMDDGVDSIREASAESMGNLMKLVSEKALYPYIEKLDKIKEAKVKDFYQKAMDGSTSMQTAPAIVKKSPKPILKHAVLVIILLISRRLSQKRNQKLKQQQKM